MSKKNKKNASAGKTLLELICCFFHPVAVVLIWINLIADHDMDLIPRLTWAIASLIPLVPFLYVLTGHELW